MKLDRMLGIMMELLTRKRVTAAALAARFEVSIRTIYRDVDLINQAGIPVASFTGTDGGFELMNGFFLTKQHFSVDDFSVIYNLLKGMEGAMGGQSVSIMQKLSSLQPALLKGGYHDKIIFDMSTSESEKEIVHPILHAINRTKVIAFSYTSASGTLSQRKAEPIKLYWERGTWYLEAYCLSHQAKRFFRVSRIANLEALEDSFHLRDLSLLPTEKEMQGLQAHLRFDVTAQPRVFEQFRGECTYYGDYIDVNTVFYSREYAMSVVLSYSSKVTIVSPEELKQDLLEKINEIQKLYT